MLAAALFAELVAAFADQASRRKQWGQTAAIGCLGE